MKRSLFVIAWLSGLAMLGAPCSASAGNTYLIATSTCTVVGVNVSTSTPTRMDSQSLPNRSAEMIQNVDVNDTLWCGVTTSVAINGGVKLTAGQTWIWGLDQSIPIYCLAQGTSAAVTVFVQSR